MSQLRPLVLSLTILALPHLVASSFAVADDEAWMVTTRRFVRSDDGRSLERVQNTAAWRPSQTAIVIVDMWDDHHCRSAAARVAEMALKMNEVVKAARDRGMLIIHAPSDCMDFYKDAAARRNAQQAPHSAAQVKFQWNYFNPEHEGTLAEKLEKGGCSCDTPEPCSPSYRAWKRQIATIEIQDQDAVSADGQEVYNLLQQRGIQNVILGLASALPALILLAVITAAVIVCIKKARKKRKAQKAAQDPTPPQDPQ